MYKNDHYQIHRKKNHHSTVPGVLYKWMLIWFSICCWSFHCSKYHLCCILLFGWFPGVWILCADISEHCLFQVVSLHHLWGWNRQSGPKRQHIKFRCLGITQKKECNIQNTAKIWNQEKYPWFQAFAVFCLLYAIFWVIPRCLEFICRRFGTLCLFHLH